MTLASRGLRDMGCGLEEIPEAQRSAVRSQARSVTVRAVLSSAALTLLTLLLP